MDPDRVNPADQRPDGRWGPRARGAAAAAVPPGAPAWVTPELIEHTLRVWQRRCQKKLTPEQALEMVLNAGNLLDALGKAAAS